MRNCTKCGDDFEPLERLKETQKLCSNCVLDVLGDMMCESVLAMTDEEVEQELREEGVDVEAFRVRLFAMVDKALADCEKDQA
jgi:rRNA-processing protein FCF1